MDKIAMAIIDRYYRNNGQEAERIFAYTLTGKLYKADNVPFWVDADVLNYQVKSARATVCRGTDIVAHFAMDKAEKYAYVSADFSVAVIMTKAEYIDFCTKFATITRESTSNGGAVKMRLGHETKKMRQYLGI